MPYPYESEFEPKIMVGGTAMLDGKIEMVVTDPLGVPATNIIAVEDSLNVAIKVELTGPLTGMLAGHWALDLFLERYGPGPDVPLQPTFYTAIVPGVTTYNWPFSFGSGVLKGLGLTGAYRIIAVLTSLQNDGVTPAQLAAYCEGPILQFHKAKTP